MNKRHIARVLGWRHAEPDEKVWGQSASLAELIKKRGPHTYWVGLEGPGDFAWIWLKNSLTDQEFLSALLYVDPIASDCPEQLLPILQAPWPTMDGVVLAGQFENTGFSHNEIQARGLTTVPGRMSFTVLERKG